MVPRLFLLPPPPNFAKIHARGGRGRLAVGCRDLIPPWSTPGVPGAACLGSGLCRVGVLPGAGARADSSCGIHVHVGFGQRFLEALNRAKPDTLESFAAIWYRHNSEAGYYWEMLARHHYDHSFSYLPGALASPDITAIRTASSIHILSDLSTSNLCFRYPLCYNIITFYPGSYPAGHRFESCLSHTHESSKQKCFELFLFKLQKAL